MRTEDNYRRAKCIADDQQAISAWEHNLKLPRAVSSGWGPRRDLQIGTNWCALTHWLGAHCRWVDSETACVKWALLFVHLLHSDLHSNWISANETPVLMLFFGLQRATQMSPPLPFVSLICSKSVALGVRLCPHLPHSCRTTAWLGLAPEDRS